MSLLLLDGFEDGYWSDRYSTFSLNGSVNTTSPRSGSYRATLGASTASIQTRIRYSLANADAHSTIIVGCAWNPISSGGYVMTLLGDSGATRHIVLLNNASNRSFEIRLGTISGTLLASTDVNAYSLNIWQYIELRVVLSDTVGEIQLRVNNTTLISATGIDTRFGGTNATIDSIDWGSPASSGNHVDDIYVCNGAGVAPHNTFLGDVRVLPQVPDGNGNYSQFVGSDADSIDNYLHMDEVGTPNTADYVQSTITGDRDSYSFSPLGISANANIVGVMTSIHAQKSDSGARSVRLFHRESGVDTNDATNQILGTSWQTFDWLHAVNPRTGTDWSTTTVNNAEWGVEARP